MATLINFNLSSFATKNEKSKKPQIFHSRAPANPSSETRQRAHAFHRNVVSAQPLPTFSAAC